MNISITVENFLTYCQEQKCLSPKTIYAYSVDLHQFCAQTNNTFCKIAIEKYISYMHREYKPKTVRRKIATLKAFSHYLLLQDEIETNPFSKIDTSFREEQILPKTIPIDTIRDIFMAAYSNYNKALTLYSQKCALRDIAVLEILFATGARVSEVCFQTIETLDLTNHTMRILGKGSKERILHIENAEVLKALTAYYNAFANDIANSGFFFVNKLGHRLSEQSVREMLNRYAQQINYRKHITPHMFRHSFASYLLEEDVDIRYIQKILGHSSITTTQIYTHVSLPKQREILSTKHPRNKMKLTKQEI